MLVQSGCCLGQIYGNREVRPSSLAPPPDTNVGKRHFLSWFCVRHVMRGYTRCSAFSLLDVLALTHGR